MFYIYDIKTAETIKKVYEFQSIKDGCNEEIIMAFIHYHYYVNLNNYKAPFEEHYLREKKYFMEDVENGALNISSRDDVYASVCLRVIKELFDLDYFEERLEYHKNNDDRECLYEYMHLLSIPQLKELLPVVLGSLFVFPWHEKGVEKVWDMLNEACLEKDLTAPVIREIYDKYGYFDEKIEFYFFDYLDKETVIKIICGNICDEYKYNAAVLARVMYTEGMEEVKHTESLWWCD